MRNDERPDLLTVKEAATWLREDPRSVRRRIADGTLPAFRVGAKRIVIRREDVDLLLRPIAPDPVRE